MFFSNKSKNMIFCSLHLAGEAWTTADTSLNSNSTDINISTHTHGSNIYLYCCKYKYKY